MSLRWSRTDSLTNAASEGNPPCLAGISGHQRFSTVSSHSALSRLVIDRSEITESHLERDGVPGLGDYQEEARAGRHVVWIRRQLALQT